MGISIAIAGGISISAIMILFSIVGSVTDKIQSESDERSKSFDIDNAFSKTGMELSAIDGDVGIDTINFNFNNIKNEKLWNYKKFDLFITYDANIGGVGTRVTEQFTYNATTAFQEKVATGTPQFLRPDGVLSEGWELATGCTIGTNDEDCINEAVRDDTDYITSSLLQGDQFDIVEFSLLDVTTPPVKSNHIVRYTYREELGNPPNPDLTVTLNQGATLIASWTENGPLPGSFAQSSRTLTIAEANGITDYNDLRLEFEARCNSCPNGPPPTRERVSVSWAEMQVPGIGAGLVTLDDLLAGGWTINQILPNVFDPGIINTQEEAQVVARLSYPIFSNGFLQISINSDNGRVESDSIIVT